MELVLNTLSEWKEHRLGIPLTEASKLGKSEQTGLELNGQKNPLPWEVNAGSCEYKL